MVWYYVRGFQHARVTCDATVDICATCVAVWVRKLDFDQSSNDAAGKFSGRAGKESSVVDETSFQYGCCC